MLETLSAEQRHWYRPFAYLHEEMGPAFRAADLVVARAGASMLGEGPAFGLPAILIPLTFAWRYQKVNADYLTDRGAAVQLVDENLAEDFLPTVSALLKNEERLAEMSSAAKALDKPEATSRLAGFITSLGEERGIMIGLVTTLWIMIGFFAIVDMQRGWTRAVIATAGLILSLFAINQFAPFLFGALGYFDMPFNETIWRREIFILTYNYSHHCLF